MINPNDSAWMDQTAFTIADNIAYSVWFVLKTTVKNIPVAFGLNLLYTVFQAFYGAYYVLHH